MHICTTPVYHQSACPAYLRLHRTSDLLLLPSCSQTLLMLTSGYHVTVPLKSTVTSSLMFITVSPGDTLRQRKENRAKNEGGSGGGGGGGGGGGCCGRGTRLFLVTSGVQPSPQHFRSVSRLPPHSYRCGFVVLFPGYLSRKHKTHRYSL